MHKRLMNSVLAAMDGERGAYFADVTETLSEDQRIERNGNLVFLFFAAAAPFLPMNLTKRELIGRLITFVERNQHRIVKTAFDPQFLTDRDIIKPIVNEFVMEMTALVLRKADEGEIDDGSGTTYHMSYPIDPNQFPYYDEDDDEDGLQ